MESLLLSKTKIKSFSFLLKPSRGIEPTVEIINKHLISFLFLGSYILCKYNVEKVIQSRNVNVIAFNRQLYLKVKNF